MEELKSRRILKRNNKLREEQKKDAEAQKMDIRNDYCYEIDTKGGKILIFRGL